MELSIEQLDHTFERLYEIAENQSDDAEKKVAAITLSRSLHAWNSFVRGASGLPNTRPDKYEYIIHAEANLVATAARCGIKLQDEVILCTLSPCQNCIRTMFQAGIREIYYKETYRAHNIEMRDIKVTETKVGEYTRMLLTNHE